MAFDKMKRRAAREEAFRMIYESGYRIGDPGLDVHYADLRQDLAEDDELPVSTDAVKAAAETAEAPKAADAAPDASGSAETPDALKAPSEAPAAGETEAEPPESDEDKYILDVYFGVFDHLADLDAQITENSVGWKPDRLSRISNAIMRLSVYEMLYRTDVPYKTAIDEAVELAKKYDAPDAPAFVNGVLNAVATKKNLKTLPQKGRNRNKKSGADKKPSPPSGEAK